MLLPPQTDLIALAVAGCGLFGTLAYLIRGGRLFWVVAGGAVMTLVFVVLFILTLTLTSKVVRIVPAGAGAATARAERAFLLGSTTVDAGGKRLVLERGDAETLIVNETARPLVLRGEIYSQFRISAAEQPRDVTIAPYSVVPIDGFIDYLGPENPLPQQVSSKSSTVTKYWLTW